MNRQYGARNMEALLRNETADAFGRRRYTACGFASKLDQ
jgi:hypothetical protein